MTWTIIKWVMGIAVLIIAAMALLGKKTFHVEIMISAPPSAVWTVLMDSGYYPEWNPVFIEVDGSYKQGAKVLNKVRDPSGAILEMTATVAELVPERVLRQTGGVTGLLTFDHQWIIEPVEDGSKVTQHEVDRGFWLWFWDSSWILPAYTKTNEALRDRVMQIINN